MNKKPTKPAKKVASKKTTTTKATATKKPSKTSIIAHVDVGYGNMLYIRGEGANLSWQKGLPLKNLSTNEWAFETNEATGTINFKFLINDQIWAEGADLSIKAGSQSVSSPNFVW